MSAKINTKSEARREREAANAAYEAMRAARPLKPPPLPRSRYTPRSSELALLHDIRQGAYTP